MTFARALYVSPIAYGCNDAVDAIGHGIDDTLGAHGIDMRVQHADFRETGWHHAAVRAIDDAVNAGYRAIIGYLIEPEPLRAALGRAREHGVSVCSFIRPPYPIDGSVIIPAFDQGMRMAESMAEALAPGARVCIIPGPGVPEEIEEMIGVAHGLRTRGLRLLNDPTDTRFHNVSEERGARDAACRVLSAFPEFEGLLPYNDVTALGALDVLEEAGRLEAVTVISRNGSPGAIEAVRAGRSYGTWDIDPPEIGRRIGSLVTRHVSTGRASNDEIELGPLGRLYTRDNIDTWRPYSDRVPLTPFRLGLTD